VLLLRVSASTKANQVEYGAFVGHLGLRPKEEDHLGHFFSYRSPGSSSDVSSPHAIAYFFSSFAASSSVCFISFAIWISLKFSLVITGNIVTFDGDLIFFFSANSALDKLFSMLSTDTYRKETFM
jgi:hypothetical protein